MGKECIVCVALVLEYQVSCRKGDWAVAGVERVERQG